MIFRGGSCLGGQQLQHGDLATSATCSAATQVNTSHLTPPHYHTTTQEPYLVFVTDTTDGVCVKKIARCKFLQI